MIIVLIWFLCAITCAIIASGKKRDPFAWLVAGCMLGIFAVIMICAIPALPERENNRALLATMATLLIAGLGGLYVYGQFFAYS